MTGALGFSAGETEGARRRYSPVDSGTALVDIVELPAAPQARESAGSVHHVAWRVKDDAEQLEWQGALRKSGAASPTQVMDRQYFHSIYFREPGGVLFEIATDPPGFSIDEPVHALGTHLKLPPWLETDKTAIERHLPPLSVPAPARRESA